jgi:hypothetical protein
MSDEAGVSEEKMAGIVRDMINHESDVINHRMSWMGTFQGLLFAAVAIMWDKNREALGVVLCLLGVVVSVAIALTLRNASVATERLVLWWTTHKPDNYDGPGVIGYRMELPSKVRTVLPPWTLVPICFLLAWIAVLYIKLFHR